MAEIFAIIKKRAPLYKDFKLLASSSWNRHQLFLIFYRQLFIAIISKWWLQFQKKFYLLRYFEKQKNNSNMFYTWTHISGVLCISCFKHPFTSLCLSSSKIWSFHKKGYWHYANFDLVYQTTTMVKIYETNYSFFMRQCTTGKVQLLFSRGFLPVSKTFSVWEDNWALDLHSMKFRDFPDIS